MLCFRHCTAAAVLVRRGSAAGACAVGRVANPRNGRSTLTIFLRGVEVGLMQSNVARAGSAWVLTSTGRFGDVVLNRLEIKYDADWQPTDMRLEATQADRQMLVVTSFGLTTAINEVTQAGDDHRQDRPGDGAQRRPPQ